MKISKIKLILCVVVFFIIGGMLSTLSILYYQKNKLIQELAIAVNNERAYMNQYSSLKEENKAFLLTLDALEYSNDSLVQKLNKVRKELKIKDKELESLLYLTSSAKVSDTIRLVDTIFKETFVSFDTLIYDNWHSQHIVLRYPNYIQTTPMFRSEKYIIVNTDKETIRPPKKCKFLRLFQKKHTILEVNIVEQNPYVETQTDKFIKIIK